MKFLLSSVSAAIFMSISTAQASTLVVDGFGPEAMALSPSTLHSASDFLGIGNYQDDTGRAFFSAVNFPSQPLENFQYNSSLGSVTMELCWTLLSENFLGTATIGGSSGEFTNDFPVGDTVTVEAYFKENNSTVDHITFLGEDHSDHHPRVPEPSSGIIFGTMLAMFLFWHYFKESMVRRGC